MWIFTNRGFISAVAHRDKPQHLMVRARRLDHLRELFAGVEIQQTSNADYKYRVTVHTLDFKRMLCAQVDVLEYDNFKNSIADHEYHDACSSVWSVMHRLQPGSYQAPRSHYDLFARPEGEPPPWDDDPPMGEAAPDLERCPFCGIELPDGYCDDCTDNGY